MTKTKLIQILTATMLLLPCVAFAHIDNAALPEGCGSCHVGHGMGGQPMLAKAEEDFCYQCHGDTDDLSTMKSAGKLASWANPIDIEREFKKPYRHPVVEGIGHSPVEKLPSPSKSTVTHAECADCHNPHQRITVGPQKTYQVSAYSLSGQYLETTVNEYEICLKCHTGNNSTTGSRKDIQREFGFSARSQHPVTKPSAKVKTVSLTKSLSSGATMKCSDCHTSDDSDGPRGPHGSNYPFLLSGNYSVDPNQDESPFAYDFCYSCHDRSSILGNDSFPLHREHIVGDVLAGIRGTSCYTCHASHSSETNVHLIDFNRAAVSSDFRTGRISYTPLGDGSGECYLTCHGKEHSPGRY